MGTEINISDKSYHLIPKSCYNGEESAVCVRIAFLVILTLVTASCLFGRIVQYHCYKNRHYVQYWIMYIGLFIMLLLFMHSVYFPHVQWDFTNLLLVAVQLLSIYLYYSFWAFRLLKKESLFIYGVVPVFIFLMFAFIGLFVWSVVFVTDDADECTKPQWLIFSTSQFVIVQCLLVTVVYISCKLNHVRTVKINRWSQKAQLIFIVSVYEVISILMVIYDLFLIADAGRHCNSAVSRNKNVLVSMEVILKTLRFLIPQLAIVIIFAPLKPNRSSDPEDTVESITHKYYYPPKPQSHHTDRDPLIYSIQPPKLKPSSPEEHYPSLPRNGTYSSTSGYNFYHFKSPNTSVN